MPYDSLKTTEILNFFNQKNKRSIVRHFKPLEANSDAESNASDTSNDSNDSNSLSEASVKTYDDSEDGSEDGGRN